MRSLGEAVEMARGVDVRAVLGFMWFSSFFGLFSRDFLEEEGDKNEKKHERIVLNPR